MFKNRGTSALIVRHLPHRTRWLPRAITSLRHAEWSQRQFSVDCITSIAGCQRPRDGRINCGAQHPQEAANAWRVQTVSVSYVYALPTFSTCADVTEGPKGDASESLRRFPTGAPAVVLVGRYVRPFLTIQASQIRSTLQ